MIKTLCKIKLAKLTESCISREISELLKTLADLIFRLSSLYFINVEYHLFGWTDIVSLVRRNIIDYE